MFPAFSLYFVRILKIRLATQRGLKEGHAPPNSNFRPRKITNENLTHDS